MRDKSEQTQTTRTYVRYYWSSENKIDYRKVPSLRNQLASTLDYIIIRDVWNIFFLLIN